MKRAFVMIGAFVLGVSPLAAGEGKISGYMFGDYYYIAAHHDSTYKGQDGFQMRRIYFTYDYEINSSFSTRLRFEMNSPDFTQPSGNMKPFVKDAYLKWKNEGITLILGISPTPTFDLVEHFWGYRSVEKTPLDLQKFGPSRDFGLAVKGSLADKLIGYHFMVGNGEGNKSENNTYKKVMGEIHLSFSPFLFQVYGDWKEGEGHTDVYTYEGFLGFHMKVLKVGLLYSAQIRQMEPDTQATYRIASAFTTVKFNKWMTLLLRYDKMFDSSAEGISYIPFAQAKSNLVIAGLDFRPHELVHFIPNVEYVFYDETGGVKPDPDLYLRLTFYYKFK